MVVNIYPLVGAEGNVERRLKGAEVLYRMKILHTKCLAVAHYSTRVLGVIHILGHHGRIVRAVRQSAAERLEAALEHKARQVIDALGVPL